jgi:anti-sigma B factor antagonist
MNFIRDDGQPAFRVHVQRHDDRVVVSAEGEIDLLTVEQLRGRLDALERTDGIRLVLDLRGVTFFDSCGVHLVLDQARREPGFSVVLGGDAVRRPFEVIGLLDQIPVADHHPDTEPPDR